MSDTPTTIPLDSPPPDAPDAPQVAPAITETGMQLQAQSHPAMHTVVTAISGFAIIGAGKMVPAVVHVQALGIDGKPAAFRDLTYQWNFGDHASPYNLLPGWTAAHLYDHAGTQTITLTVTDAAGGSRNWSQQVTLAPNTRTFKVLSPADMATFVPQSNFHYQFKDGQRYEVLKGIPCNVTNVVFGHTGGGALPVIWCNPADGSSAFQLPIAPQTASEILFRGLRFDSPPDPNLKQDAPNVRSSKWMGWLSGSLLTVANCEFATVNHAMQVWQGSSCVLLQDNHQLNPNTIRGQFVWGQASNFVMLGNVGTGSVDENVCRIADQGVQYGLLYGNSMSILPTGKYPWTIRTAFAVWHENNISNNAAWGIEPRESFHEVRNCVWRNNTLNNSFFSIRPGVHDIDISGHTIANKGPAVTVTFTNAAAPGMVTDGISFNQNTCHLQGRAMAAFYAGQPMPARFSASGNKCD